MNYTKKRPGDIKDIDSGRQMLYGEIGINIPERVLIKASEKLSCGPLPSADDPKRNWKKYSIHYGYEAETIADILCDKIRCSFAYKADGDKCNIDDYKWDILYMAETLCGVHITNIATWINTEKGVRPGYYWMPWYGETFCPFAPAFFLQNDEVHFPHNKVWSPLFRIKNNILRKVLPEDTFFKNGTTHRKRFSNIYGLETCFSRADGRYVIPQHGIKDNSPVFKGTCGVPYNIFDGSSIKVDTLSHEEFQSALITFLNTYRDFLSEYSSVLTRANTFSLPDYNTNKDGSRIDGFYYKPDKFKLESLKAPFKESGRKDVFGLEYEPVGPIFDNPRGTPCELVRRSISFWGSQVSLGEKMYARAVEIKPYMNMKRPYSLVEFENKYRFIDTIINDVQAAVFNTNYLLQYQDLCSEMEAAALTLQNNGDEEYYNLKREEISASKYGRFPSQKFFIPCLCVPINNDIVSVDRKGIENSCNETLRSEISKLNTMALCSPSDKEEAQTLIQGLYLTVEVIARVFKEDMNCEYPSDFIPALDGCIKEYNIDTNSKTMNTILNRLKALETMLRKFNRPISFRDKTSPSSVIDTICAFAGAFSSINMDAERITDIEAKADDSNSVLYSQGGILGYTPDNFIESVAKADASSQIQEFFSSSTVKNTYNRLYRPKSYTPINEYYDCKYMAGPEYVRQQFNALKKVEEERSKFGLIEHNCDRYKDINIDTLHLNQEIEGEEFNAEVKCIKYCQDKYGKELYKKMHRSYCDFSERSYVLRNIIYDEWALHFPVSYDEIARSGKTGLIKGVILDDITFNKEECLWAVNEGFFSAPIIRRCGAFFEYIDKIFPETWQYYYKYIESIINNPDFSEFFEQPCYNPLRIIKYFRLKTAQACRDTMYYDNTFPLMGYDLTHLSAIEDRLYYEPSYYVLFTKAETFSAPSRSTYFSIPLWLHPGLMHLLDAYCNDFNIACENLAGKRTRINNEPGQGLNAMAMDITRMMSYKIKEETFSSMKISLPSSVDYADTEPACTSPEFKSIFKKIFSSQHTEPLPTEGNEESLTRTEYKLYTSLIKAYTESGAVSFEDVEAKNISSRSKESRADYEGLIKLEELSKIYSMNAITSREYSGYNKYREFCKVPVNTEHVSEAIINMGSQRQEQEISLKLHEIKEDIAPVNIKAPEPNDPLLDILLFMESSYNPCKNKFMRDAVSDIRKSLRAEDYSLTKDNMEEVKELIEKLKEQEPVDFSRYVKIAGLIKSNVNTGEPDRFKEVLEKDSNINNMLLKCLKSLIKYTLRLSGSDTEDKNIADSITAFRKQASRLIAENDIILNAENNIYSEHVKSSLYDAKSSGQMPFYLHCMSDALTVEWMYRSGTLPSQLYSDTDTHCSSLVDFIKEKLSSCGNCSKHTEESYFIKSINENNNIFTRIYCGECLENEIDKMIKSDELQLSLDFSQFDNLKDELEDEPKEENEQIL